VQVTIDPGSGFCFGVRHAIEAAERGLQDPRPLYCLGDIVHNDREVKRLKDLGLSAITADKMEQVRGARVMIRAHGEPPETYRLAERNRIELTDATCPIVLKLQEKVREAAAEMEEKNGQLVLYGKEGHAEVVALCGHAGGKAIVAGGAEDLHKIDYSRPVRLFSQTTMSVEGFRDLASRIRNRMEEMAGGHPADFREHDTVCRKVANRATALKEFAAAFDVVIFVSGKKSSNGKVLFEACREANPRSRMVADASELDPAWFHGVVTAGVCGATSTPCWLMEEVAGRIRTWHG